MRFPVLTPDLVAPRRGIDGTSQEPLDGKSPRSGSPGAEPQPPMLLAQGESQVGEEFTRGRERRVPGAQRPPPEAALRLAMF